MEEESDSWSYNDTEDSYCTRVHDSRSVSRSGTSSPSSSFQCSYSVNSTNEFDFTLRSIEKSQKNINYVQQMRLKFETISETNKFYTLPRFPSNFRHWRSNPGSQFGIDEVPSEEEADEVFESESESGASVLEARNELSSGINADKKEDVVDGKTRTNGIPSITIDEYEINEKIDKEILKNDKNDLSDNCSHADKPISSNYRFTAPLPRRNAINRKKRHTTILKTSNSYHPVEEDEDAHSSSDSFDSNSARDTHKQVDRCVPDKTNCDRNTEDSHEVPQILAELIATEEAYVNTLKIGIRNYCGIFDRPDLPPGLNGKKFTLFGNIEQIAEFHEMEFLPMLRRNRYNIEKLCNEFCKFVEEDYFYCYALYSINKRRSDNLCMEQRDFFLKLENSIGDKLGIISFLVQPIQRLTRYKLILNQMISHFFKTNALKYKTVLPACCKVEKNVSNLCQTVNESVQINDIKDCFEINLLYQGRFKKCSEFYVHDYTLRRGYKSMAFIFDKCFIYTEIMKNGKQPILQFRGFYPSDRLGYIFGKKSFTLYYEKRKVQECDFNADQQTLELWLQLLTDMIKTFANEEKEKLRKKYLKDDEVFRRPGSIYLLRHPSRFSNDSGIGSVFSNLSVNSNENSPRTTWYADNFTS